MTQDSDSLQLLHQHITVGESTPPPGVVRVAAALLGSPASVASLAQVDLSRPTRWTFDLIADGKLAHGEVEYNHARYTREFHSALGGQVAEAVRSAWVRPLSTIAKLAFDGDDEWSDRFSFAFGSISLTFTDGDVHRLPARVAYAEEKDRERADAFHAALLAGLGS